MSDWKFIAVLLCGGVACIGMVVWFAISVEEKTADRRAWSEQIQRRIVENCVNRGGVPTFGKWTGAVDNCVAVPK